MSAELNPVSKTHIPGRRSLQRALLFAVGAACLHGSWAFGANVSVALSAGVRAGLTQACLSFTATLVLVILLETLFRLGRTPEEGFWLAVVGAGVVATGLSATAHALAGTPHIVATLTLPTIVGTIFNIVYARALCFASTRVSVPVVAAA